MVSCSEFNFFLICLKLKGLFIMLDDSKSKILDIRSTIFKYHMWEKARCKRNKLE
jgi:hypothetical protein